jgi:toxin ParE1/3/4
VTYRLSGKAADDLEDLYVTSAREFGVAQAEAYFSGLVEPLEFLARFPLAARARPELGSQTRGHPYKAHMIFYRPDGANVITPA